MKINLKEELGLNKNFEVKTSNINVERALEMQLSMAKADATEGKSGLEIIQMTLDSVKSASQFIKDMLKMSAKESTLVDDMETGDTMLLVNRICLRLMGNTDEEIKEMFAEPVDGEDAGKE